MTDGPGNGEIHGMNIVSVKPENQQKIIDALREIGPVKEIPGLISMQLLRSIDGQKIVNYMRWESVAAFQQAEQNPQVMAAIGKITEYTEDAGVPGFYQLMYTHE
jgi:heme-degrading monooxygenase HmoA